MGTSDEENITRIRRLIPGRGDSRFSKRQENEEYITKQEEQVYEENNVDTENKIDTSTFLFTPENWVKERFPENGEVLKIEILVDLGAANSTSSFKK